MQIKATRHSENGSVLLIVLCIAIVLGICTMSYMMLISTQHKLVSRSQGWNTALTLAEAGIEDGLAQINVTFGTNYSPSARTNWGFGDGLYGPRSKTFTNIGSYNAIIIATNGLCPSIIATGYASVPYASQPIQRVIQVDTTNTPMFMVAMAVKLNITTKGNNLTVDSYDSSDPNHSTNGIYNAATRLAGGDIASLGGFVNVQNANIYGKLKTGPGGSYTIGNGSVGDLNWNVPGQIEPGWYENDFNMVFKDVDPPFTTGVGFSKVNSGTNTYVLSGDYFLDSDFSLAQGETLYIAGNTRLYVTGNFTMKSQNLCFISIAPGATFKLYVGTPNGLAVATQLTLVNTTGAAGSFQYYGLPSNTSITWSGNANYVGVVYAPEADFSAGGGGSTDYDFQGSCTVNSVTLNGHFNFHYDQALSRSKPGSGFMVTAWREL